VTSYFAAHRLWFLSLWAPIIIVSIIGGIFPLVASTFPNNNPLHNIHGGICTILTAIGISEFVTQVFKFYVGRLRPNFYAMCGFDKATLACTNGEEMEMEARMSFPSGHSSLSYCGMMALVLFFIGRAGLGRVGKQYSLVRYKFSVLLSFVPLLFSFWCATSRLVDNWHHPSDIIAGSILGVVSACIAYHIWYPHVLAVHAGIPLSVVQLSREETSVTGPNFMLLDKQISLPVRS
jgi:membrane-associated phospholipid phosphatase